VNLQGKTVLDRLDIFATVDLDRALDKSDDNIQVTDGWLNISLLGEPLPEELVQLPSEYVGPTRLIVPTVPLRFVKGNS